MGARIRSKGEKKKRTMATNLTVVQLKEILRSRGHATTGSKAELLQRLEEFDPMADWTNEIRTEEVAQGTEDGDDMRRELELIRRENALLERELQLARREADHAYRESHPLSPQFRRNDETRLKLSEIKELLAAISMAAAGCTRIGRDK